ncbi:MAG TPA: ABC transporter substrate-binding protein [Aggregatilineales bacterium]|nr:ABC transporter substrate-binding protein [Anaerolineales bacterium]HRE47276.1 ABC transporter substrate-binding protein [Aggregatilineales bacterium]
MIVRNPRFTRRPLALTLVIALMALMVLPACSTTPSKIITIGIVNFAPVLDTVVNGFKEGMADLGWREGVNIRYLYEGDLGGVRDKVTPAIQAYLDQNVDLLLAISTPVAQDAKVLFEKSEYKKRQFVFSSVLDPIFAKIVTEEEIVRREGNFTGIRHGVNEPKRMEWFLRLAPEIKTVYVPFNPNDAAAVINLQVVKEIAAKFGVSVIERETPDAAAVRQAIDEIPTDIPGLGLVLLADNVVASQLNYFTAVALQRKLPLSVPNGPQVPAGGLLAYGFDFTAIGRQSARLVDQVLKGVAPGDLPIETAEFFLTINQWVANQIGLPISDAILRQADRVIYTAPAPTATPIPPTPSNEATAEPTNAPISAPTTVPTGEPTTPPTEIPPTELPTSEPTPEPTTPATATPASF